MTAIRTVFISLLLLLSGVVLAQQPTYMFNHFKSKGDKIILYFQIDDLGNDKEEQDRVLGELLKDDLISDGNIYSVENQNPTCQIEVAQAVSVEYIRNILQSTGYDIDLTSLSTDGLSKPNGDYSSERVSFFEGFTGFEYYDPNEPGALSAEDHYAKEKDSWVAQHPEEYEKAKKQNGTAIVVRRKDFESFTAEKRQHMLNHPEMFIIEE
jgi:hypothetical protein